MTPENQNSVLATTAYWDNWYHEELKQFEDNNTLGEEWYGNYQEHVLDWISSSWNGWCTNVNVADVSLLDIGTGNGLFLYRLAEVGFRKLYGVDYLESAIRCARAFRKKIATGEVEVEDSNADLTKCEFHFDVDDIMAPSRASDKTTGENPAGEGIEKLLASDGPMVIHDKGTLDVFYLRSQIELMVKRVCEKYATNPNCIWIISSGNLTHDELKGCIEQFSDFREIGRMRSLPQLSFQGHSGTTLATMAFQRPAACLTSP
ncbi:putative methyltransferase domain protein [Gregarina niphandrodes]|uniref:Methyltransferase domain protein n=1 Tax=Gregarina niphandrodes TaxID=110365 RepID=A0A023B7W0_GRENI|nr:putative methyltransferase domain protein [Gregarina niphandrodes]EZG68069.1 putative methyltransferase domain protein [Gregarina niphandrodes]|eukprot:XP_011130110.1 putative methyltransferase domain protein [Gregarina niphandrodes]